MKFKIYKQQADSLLRLFKSNEKENGYETIELEAVMEKATQVIYEQQLKNKAFEEGIEYGYKEGFHDGRCPEKRMRYCNCCCR